MQGPYRRSSLAVLLTAGLIGSVSIYGQDRRPIAYMSQTNARGPAPKEIAASDIPGVVKGGTKVTLIASGFGGGEGAIAMPDGSLLFTDLENKILKVDKDDRVSTYLDKTNRTSGHAFDSKGRLIATQSGDRKVVSVMMPTRSVLAESFEGQPFTGPNDLVIDRKGGIYFTDPNVDAGRRPLIFYITPGGQVTIATEQISYPNGVQLSPDEKTLYATNGTAIIAFDVQENGGLTNARTFAASAGDGMAIDSEGRLYATLSWRWHPKGDLQGVRVFSPTGDVLGVIPTGVPPSSVAFAGPEKKTLYIVGQGGVQKVAMIAQGVKSRAK